jgi:hypothetical protein
MMTTYEESDKTYCNIAKSLGLPIMRLKDKPLGVARVIAITADDMEIKLFTGLYKTVDQLKDMQDRAAVCDAVLKGQRFECLHRTVEITVVHCIYTEYTQR